MMKNTTPLTMARANTMLEKLGFPVIRAPSHFEQGLNEYGEKCLYVVDRGEFTATQRFTSLAQAMRAILNYADEVDEGKLTEAERALLKKL